MAEDSSATLDCLQDDMIFEILRRPNFNTLDICKAVCKDWNKLVYDPSFIENYYNRKDNVFGYLLQDTYHSKFQQAFVSINESDNSFMFSTKGLNRKVDDVQILGSSLQGILCCVNRYNGRSRFYVCKPTTGQWQHLPNPKLRYTLRGIGFAVLSSNPLHFVVIRISKSTTKGLSKKLADKYCYQCEIFDSKIWRWKELDDLLLPSGTVFTGIPAVYASGYISWMTCQDDVLSFTTDGKTRRILAKPEAARYDKCDYRRIVEYEGKLGYCFTAADGMHVELWTLEDRNNCVWKKIHAVDLQSIRRTPDAFYNSSVAFLFTYGEAIFNRLSNSSCKHVKLSGFPHVMHIFPFRSDFEPVNFKAR